MFYYVYRIQCLGDGSAFFGIKQTQAIDWGESGNFFSLGIRPQTKKFQERVTKFGIKPWRLTIYECTTEKERAEKNLENILAQTRGHPLCLNYDPVAHKEAVIENLKLADPSAANKDVPKPAAQKKKISKAMKKFMEKKKEENVAAGKPDAPLTTGPADMRWIHNKKTNEEMMIYNDEDILTDFEEGRLPKA